MTSQALRAALERHFDAPRLSELARDALGLEGFGGEIANGDDATSLIDELLRHCSERHLLEALGDAIRVYEPATREALTSESRVDDGEPPLSLEAQWGSFRVQEYLGRGPTGDCYRATQADGVARLKVLRAAADSSALQRVLTHARLLNRLSAPGLTVTGWPKNIRVGVVDERAYIASDWQPGKTLRQLLDQDGPLAPEAAIRLASAVLVTLHQLHEAGLCAGSLKSSNILVDPQAEGTETSCLLLDLSSNLLLGKSSSPSDDLVALGCVLFEMLSATPPEVSKASVRVPPSAAGGAQFVAPDLDDLVVSLLNGKLTTSSASELRELLQNVSLSGNSDDAAIEHLLETSEASGNKQEKAALLHKIGSIYERQRNDGDQALVAYIQALCEDPLPPAHAVSVNRVAGQNPERWHDVLAAAGEAVSILDPPERKILLLQLGTWATRLNQTDTALSAFSAALELDPSSEPAGDALEQIYRDRQQWSDLRSLLLRRARDSKNQDRAADLAIAAAEIAEQRLSDPISAVQEYARVLEQAPLNEPAFQALSRHYEKNQDFSNLQDLLRKRAQVSSGPAAATLHRRVAELYLHPPKDPAQARSHFELALQHDDTSKEAWLGLERLLVEENQAAPLLDLLAKRLSVAATPRERLELLLRSATLYEQDLLDPKRALQALSEVLQIDPHHEQARSAIIRNHLRAADKSLSSADVTGASEHLRSVLALDAENLAALKALSTLELKQGNGKTALPLLEKQIALTASDQAKAALLVEVAKLNHEQLGDLEGARVAIERALQQEPNSADAAARAGDIAYEQGRHRDAVRHYQVAIPQLRSIAPEAAQRLLQRQVDSLIRAGTPSLALELLAPLLELAANDRATLALAANLMFEHGTPAKAVELHERLLQEHRVALTSDELPVLLLRLGESHLRTGSPQAAIVVLEEAADLEPAARKPLDALASAYGELAEWNSLLKVKQRLLDLSEGAARAEILAEMAAITSDKLGDKTAAIRSLVAAVEDKPDDRKLLTRLMALYSEDKEWLKLLDIVSRLEALTDNPDQKTKYLLTLAMVSQRELHDPERALQYYKQVLTFAPDHAKAASESLTLAMDLGKLETVEQLLNEQLQRAQQAGSHAELLAIFLQLGRLYKERLHKADSAVDAFEAAQTLEPQNPESLAALDELYGADLDRYRDKAIALHTSQLHHNPFRPEPYQQLRRLYTGLRRADPAWCLCRTLNALSLSSPEEDQFYDRLRSEEAVVMEQPLGVEEWHLLLHPDADPLLTDIFTQLEPVVLRVRGASLEHLGYDPQATIDLTESEHPAAQTLLYVAGALAQQVPLVFTDESQGDAITLLASESAAVVMGAPFLDANASTQSLVFNSARALCGLLPGQRLRHLLSSGTGFKSWLLAAIRLNAPTFPIPPELVGPVEEAQAALRELLHPQGRDELASLIARLLQSPSASLDVKQWQVASEFGADRVGFLLANDLRTAIEAIRNGSAELTAGQAARIKELVLFSVDESYFKLRKQLQISVDGQ